MNSIVRVYVAGLLTPRGYYDKNPAIDYIVACRKMILCGLELLCRGFSPFVPALDREMFLLAPDGSRPTEKQIKDYSITWLEVCDAMLLLPGWGQSPGTLDEIRAAIKLDIPIFDSVENLIDRKQVDLGSIRAWFDD